MMWEMKFWCQGWEDPLEKGMATHSSILAWRIPWTEEPGAVQFIGYQMSRIQLSNWTQTPNILYAFPCQDLCPHYSKVLKHSFPKDQRSPFLHISVQIFPYQRVFQWSLYWETVFQLTFHKFSTWHKSLSQINIVQCIFRNPLTEIITVSFTAIFSAEQQWLNIIFNKFWFNW